MSYEDLLNYKTGYKCAIKQQKSQVNKHFAALDCMTLLPLDLIKGFCLAIEM